MYCRCHAMHMVHCAAYATQSTIMTSMMLSMANCVLVVMWFCRVCNSSPWLSTLTVISPSWTPVTAGISSQHHAGTNACCQLTSSTRPSSSSPRSRRPPPQLPGLPVPLRPTSRRHSRRSSNQHRQRSSRTSSCCVLWTARCGM